ncbi:MAG: lysophospholipid acyltransferase family protein [Candidatus Fermentibacter sp.]|nr:lysophospholipid acyltransferase family protein [Candidatus Fermentibacter sp.]
MMDGRSMHAIQRCGRAVFRIVFGLRISVAGRIPRTGGLLIASNHISDMDPPVLGSCIPRTVRFMAKSELFRGRALSWMFTQLGAFPVNRRGVDRTALRTAESILGDGGALLIFPEGTRSMDGRPLPPKPGVGLLASKMGVPVLPAFLHGTDRPLSALARRPRFSVCLGRLIFPAEMEEAGRSGGTSAMAGLVMDRIVETGAEAGLIRAERSAN